ncbi:Uncharacterised protein [Staphylococcus aureus]|nr:Uncharacterised protein [Staphylococcus aureus]
MFGKTAYVNAKANEAPEFKPMSAGSARLLRVTPCIIAPETASAIPTITAAIFLGILISLMMFCC